MGPRAGREPCTTCSVGCRIVDAVEPRPVGALPGVDSDPVNWGWLCDRGRFDFEAVNSDDRLGAPLVRGESGLAETSWNGALGVATASCARRSTPVGRTAIGILGGARGTNEDAFAWAKLADARHRRRATPSSATVCRRPCSDSPGRPSTRRRQPRRSCSSRPTQRGAAGPVPTAARRRREAPQPDPRVLADRVGSHEVDVEERPVRARRRRRRHQRHAGRARRGRTVAKGNVVVVAGRANSPSPRSRRSPRWPRSSPVAGVRSRCSRPCAGNVVGATADSGPPTPRRARRVR